jgi:hypothetical protein
VALENQQSFQAPSLPKMGKDSSPLMKSANKISFSFAKPKLKTSKMSFVRVKKAQAIKAEDLKGPETVSTGSLATTLTETNKILVEIQNQLAIDFANRIAEKKQTLKLSRKQVKKKKLVAKEDFVERGKGLSGNIKDFGKKVLSPIKGIFDKIIEFLTIVGTGIALNAAFEWLQDEKNREKLVRVFNFLRDHWKTLLAIAIGGKILSLLLKLQGLFSLARSLVRRIRSLSGQKPPVPPKPPGTTPPPGGTKPSTSAPKPPPPKAPISPGGPKSPILGPGGKPVSTQLPGTTPGRAPFVPKPGQGIPKPPPGLGRGGGMLGGAGRLLGKALAPLLILDLFLTTKEIVNPNDNIITNLMDLGTTTTNAFKSDPFEKSLTEPRGDINTMREGSKEMISWKNNDSRNRRVLAERRVADPKKYLEQKQSIIKKYPSTARFYDNPDPLNKYNLKPPTGYSKGGTIPGDGPTNVDSVPTILAPKEEVIQAPAANRFRPVLKDINNNYGRMFLSFKSGVEQQARNFKLQQEETNRTISLFKEFSDLVEKRVRKLELKEIEKPGGIIDLLNRMQGDQSEQETQTTLASVNGGSTQPQASLMSNTTPIVTPQTDAFMQVLRKISEKHENNKPKTPEPELEPVKKSPIKLQVIDFDPEKLQTYDLRKGSQQPSGEGSIETMNLNLPPTVIKTPKQQQQAQPQEQTRESSSSDILIAPMDLDNPFFGRSLSAYGVEL